MKLLEHKTWKIDHKNLPDQTMHVFLVQYGDSNSREEVIFHNVSSGSYGHIQEVDSLDQYRVLRAYESGHYMDINPKIVDNLQSIIEKRDSIYCILAFSENTLLNDIDPSDEKTVLDYLKDNRAYFTKTITKDTYDYVSELITSITEEYPYPLRVYILRQVGDTEEVIRVTDSWNMPHNWLEIIKGVKDHEEVAAP
jgi:hypothetical protein